MCTNVINATRVEECIQRKSAREYVGLEFKLFFCFDEYFVPKSTSSVLFNFFGMKI